MRRDRFGGYSRVAAALLLAAVACSEGTTAPAAQTTSPTSTSEATVVAVTDADLGEILTDADGNTLYVFLDDADGQSACTGDCATTWPPLAVTGEPTGDGVDAELGTIERDDGTLQVTVAGSPVYLYSGDMAPGETNGQSVGDVWYVVSASGGAVTSSDGGGRYGY